jgi:hypothetical protein
VSGLTFVACSELESRINGHHNLAQAIRLYAHPQRIKANSK